MDDNNVGEVFACCPEKSRFTAGIIPRLDNL